MKQRIHRLHLFFEDFCNELQGKYNTMHKEGKLGPEDPEFDFVFKSVSEPFDERWLSSFGCSLENYNKMLSTYLITFSSENYRHNKTVALKKKKKNLKMVR